MLRQCILPTELWTQIASYLPVRDAALLSGGFMALAETLLLPRESQHGLVHEKCIAWMLGAESLATLQGSAWMPLDCNCRA